MTAGVAEDTYIAFLREVNVGGRKAPMALVRELFAELGLRDVRSYIASGNVFFTLPESGSAPGAGPGGADRSGLTRAIEERLRTGLGFEVPVMLRTVAELEAALLESPFDQVEVTPEVRLSVVFPSAPLTGLTLPLRSPKGDWEVLGTSRTSSELFVVMRLENGRLGGNPIAGIEKNFDVLATARFFHTTAKILAAARKS